MIKIEGIYTNKRQIKTISKRKKNIIVFNVNDWNMYKTYKNKFFRDVSFLWYINIL